MTPPLGLYRDTLWVRTDTLPIDLSAQVDNSFRMDAKKLAFQWWCEGDDTDKIYTGFALLGMKIPLEQVRQWIEEWEENPYSEDFIK